MPTQRDALLEYLRNRRSGTALPVPTVAQPAAGVGMVTSSPTEQLLDYLRARKTGAVAEFQAPTPPPIGAAAQYINQLPEGVREGVGGALRGIASFLEPLQLPQDALFAVLAGSLDKNTTITERLRSMELSDYLPGGEAPERPASGAEIISLMGFDENTARWAGIAADLVVDPLVFGSWLRVTGKLTKLDDLVRLGDRVDTFISPLGLAREANKVARRSNYISDFQDRRMTQLLSLLRNPDSELFGIQRFGERATRVLESVVPRDAMLRLRFGNETGQALFKAEQTAAGKARKLSTDAMVMLQRAEYGFAGDESKSLVRTWLKAMEGQSEAWERSLAELNPLVRDMIEREVYGVAQKQAGFVPIFGGKDMAGRILDEDTAGLVQDAQRALGRFDDEVQDFSNDLLANYRTMSDEAVSAARERVVAVARREAQRAGHSAEHIERASMEAARGFDNYLKDTLQIDAKLGKAASGYDFVSDNIRARVMQLTGNEEMADRIWGNVLRTGLTLGRADDMALKDWDAFLDSSTGIIVGTFDENMLRGGQRRLAMRQAYLHAVEQERNRIAAAKEAVATERKLATQGMRGATKRTENLRRRQMLEDSYDLPERVADYVGRVRAATGGLAGRIRSEREVANLGRSLDKLTQTTLKYDDIVERLSLADATDMKLVGSMMAQERALAKELQKQIELIQGALQKSGLTTGVRASTMEAIDPNLARSIYGRAGVGSMQSELEDLMGEAGRLYGEISSMVSRKSQVANRWLEERNLAQQALRERRAQWKAGDAEQRDIANAERVALGLPREGGASWYRMVGEKAAQEAGEAIPAVRPRPMDPIPLDGHNTTFEDIMAARINHAAKGVKGQTLDDVTIRKIASDPITYRELLNGIADMQALPLHDYLRGLMNGHLRKAYAIFTDSDDFKRYIDAIRTGAVYNSRMIDEAHLEEAMVGFEREASLIRDYHTALSASGNGTVIRASGIIEYMRASGVSGERINGAMRALNAATGKGNPEWERVMALLDKYVPKYTAAREARQGRVPSQEPFVVNQAKFQERVEIPQNVLEAMGEFAQASMSLGQSIGIARTVTRRQDFFQQAWEIAQRRGLIKNEPFVDRFGVRYRQYSSNQSVMGGFAGKYIHPYLADEFKRMSTLPRDKRLAAFQRVRALVTGGYLAAPSVLAANFFGGLYQGATVGISPATMLRRMGEVYGDMKAFRNGMRSELVEALNKHHPVELSGILADDLAQGIEALDLAKFGLGKEGVARLFDDVTRKYEQFLQKPFGAEIIGLSGFQFIENWFKVASFKEMREKLARDFVRETGRAVTPADMLRFDRDAAEFARTVVFDYSTLPTSLDMLKQTGLVMFPGFSYFLAGRTISAVMNRPGTIAVADRISEAVANAATSVEDQVLAYLGSDPWMHYEQGVPFPLTGREREDGTRSISLLPIAQLVPTATLWDSFAGEGFGANPWAESITNLGMWGPLMDVVNALVSGEGDAMISGRYGHVVFEEGRMPAEKAAQVFRFLYNTMAPSVIRRGLSQDYQGRMTGLIPGVVGGFMGQVTEAPADMLDGIYSIYERRTRKPDKTWRENVLQMTLRTPQIVALDGPLAGIKRQMENERSRLQANISGLRREYENARSAGNTARANDLMTRMVEMRDEFNARWWQWTQFYQAYQARRRSQGQ